ncbi:MAG: polysaccharide pyruvyl transferase family protein, partial [Anaerolineales bacterium]|nr:polysaccharide pyruvyl transferase family protein [Anaerolineales bacterium]
ARDALRGSDVLLWAVGLDMQDDSSIARMLYLWTAFRFYRSLGLKVICLFQGAGPVTTAMGRVLARGVLSQVDTFVARDPGTFALVEKLRPRTKCILAHDAIFLPGFEEDIATVPSTEKDLLDRFFTSAGRPVIGINLRQWFHFASSLLPYQFSRQKYMQRSEERMGKLIDSMSGLIASLREREGARILLISAYQPGVRPWEDDLPWLERVKAQFKEDDEVMLVDSPLTMPAYFELMSRLDVMIGMRLHSSLVALRFGVPSINLSYTLKGGDILKHLLLAENVIDLSGFLLSTQDAFEQTSMILANRSSEREKTRRAVQQALETNVAVLKSIISE